MAFNLAPVRQDSGGKKIIPNPICPVQERCALCVSLCAFMCVCALHAFPVLLCFIFLLIDLFLSM